ncbi:flagellar assembly protein FliH [bacterium]|nr:MAG: flagellar assembly protein FliH [bacterium]
MNTLLRAETVDTVQSWNAPQVDGGSTGRKPRTVRELQAAEEAVWQRVREEARAEGLAAAKQEIDARMARLDAQGLQLDSLLELLAKPLARLDHDLEIQLTELAVAIARQLLRRELKSDPSQVIAVVRETVGLLPASARDVRVSVHPDDAALLRERLPIPQTPAWTLIEDPMLARGDCRVATDTAQIDARVEARLNAAIAHLLGDERAQERQAERGGAR